MNQSNQLSKSFRDFSEKEPSKTKYGSRDYHTEAQPEDTERIGIGFPRVGSKFDYSNFGIFFKHKASNSRGSNDSYTGRAHLKKKSNDTSSSSRESTLKRLSSKDLSNLEELYENTTVITTPQETKPHSKRVSNEIPMTKNMSEDGLEPWKEYLPEIYNDNKKKKLRGLSLSGTSITSKDEKHEQEILGTISKLGLNGENEEQKADMSFKDLKLPKNNFNAEVIERIKTKALHHRRTSASNNSGNNQDNYFAFLQNNEIEGRTNNNSVFNGGKKLNKGLSQNKNETYDLDLIESFANSDSLLFRPFESEIPVVTATFGKQSQANGPVFPKESKNQELTNDLGNKKTNLSTIPTENSVDSDNIAASNFNYHNNSFSTLFSGTNNSFNNSGKIDFNSPQRIDPEKPIENLRATMTNPQLISKISIQKTLFTPNQQIGTVCEGHGSGNNTDRSNSLSWNEDQNTNSNFSSALSTPQGLQKQSFLNTNLNVTSYSRTSQNIKNNNNKFPTSNQDLIKSLSKGISNTDNADYNPKGPMKQNKPKPNNRLEQDQKDNSFFVVDVNKIEADTRTTLMVKNIPNKYDLPLLLQTVEKNHKGKFDFLYLPIDPRNKCNVGYAFINFIETKYVKDFFNEFNGKKWEKFNSEKVCDIKYGRIQGKKALIHHFQYSNVMSQQDQKLKPHIPAEFEPINNKKIKDLVNKQKLQSGGDNL